MKELAKLTFTFTFTVPETAGLLGISRAHAYELVARKEPPAIRLGRRVLVPRQAIEDFPNASSDPDGLWSQCGSCRTGPFRHLARERLPIRT